MDVLCPYVGLEGDPKTSTVFPTSSHLCFRADPAQHVGLEHQRLVCLCEKHTECQGFITGWPKGLPRALRKKRKRQIFATGKYMTGATIGLGIGLLAGAAYMVSTISPAPIATLEGSLAAGLMTSTEAIEPPTATPSAATATPQPSETPAPTITPSFTPGPVLMTPFGSPQTPFLIYEVATGDSYQLIATRYNTTTAVLTAINVRESLLWPGDRIVVCVDCTETPDLPQLSARYLEEGISLSELAQECGCPAEMLQEWNGLGESDWVMGDRWIVVPVR